MIDWNAIILAAIEAVKVLGIAWLGAGAVKGSAQKVVEFRKAKQ